MVRHRSGSPRWTESSARIYFCRREQHIVLIAHDFNTLLTEILGSADTALLHLEADQPAREFIEEVPRSSRLAAEFTRQIQAYSGTSPFEVWPMDVSKETRRRGELLRAAISERILDRLRSVRPDVPVLLISGYARIEAMTRFAKSGNIAGFLSEPFRSQTLAARAREALGRVCSAPDQ